MLPDIQKEFYNFIDVNAEDLLVKEYVDTILDMAEAYIYEQYRVAIKNRQITEILSGNGTNKLYISNSIINSVYLLTENGIKQNIDDLKLFNVSYIYRPNLVFSRGTYNIEIVYNIGYTSILNIPKTLLQALYLVGRKIYTDFQKNMDTFSTISAAGQSIKTIDNLPLLATNILETYRLYKF